MAFFIATYHQLVSKTPSGVPRAPSAGCGFPYHILSPTSLNPNCLTSCLDRVIYYFNAHSIAHSSLEWHVWSSSSGNNCHAVQRSLSSGASVYECIMGFLPCPISSAKSPTRSLSITGHWNVSLPSGASLWNGMFARAEGQYITNISHVHKIFRIWSFFHLSLSLISLSLDLSMFAFLIALDMQPIILPPARG